MKIRRWRLWSRNHKRRVLFSGGLLGLLVGSAWYTTAMPGSRYHGPFAPLDAREKEYRAELKEIVTHLSVTIGERTTEKVAKLDEARDYLSRRWTDAGFTVVPQAFVADGVTSENLEVILEGTSRKSEVVVVGGHYDSAVGATGADDNASGAAATMVLAARLAKLPHTRTLRFVLFVNEEPPHFWNGTMGSLAYANALHAKKTNVVGMLSLETIAYFRTEPGTQRYPLPLAWLKGDVGDYIGFVGNLSSRSLTRQAVGVFRNAVKFPSDGAVLPERVPGVGWSDHWSFWQNGYDAVMVTDTAPFRNPNYHTMNDLPATLDWDRYARVVRGLEAVISSLGNP